MANQAKTLLVVDYDPRVRSAVAAYLGARGMQVIQSGEGREALRLFRQHQPDVVLCDLHMPVGDGVDVLRDIAEDPLECPIIVLSDRSDTTGVVEALRLGATDYLHKPIIDMQVLEHAVTRCLEQARLRQENRAYRAELERANHELTEHLAALERDQQAGRQIQLRMLPPKALDVHGFQFAHRVFPSLYLSGDFLDYVTVGTDHIVFLIADVSGHGVSSAFVTVLLKNITARLRSHYNRHGDTTILEPARLLHRINEEVLATQTGKHVTLFVATLDLRSGTIRYVVAGHLPLPVLVADGKAHYLEGKGLPIGLFEDVEYQEIQLELPPKFQLWLFSDGVLELLKASSLEEQERKLRALCQDVQDIDALVRYLELVPGQPLPDDIAIMTVSRRPDAT